MFNRFGLYCLLLCVWLIALSAQAAGRGERVAVELMIAIDVSDSINEQELAFQIDGIVRAFRDERLIQSIEGLPTGGLAVAVMFWAGKGEQQTMLPWFRVHDKDSSLALAQALANFGGSPWKGHLFTALGNALNHAYVEIMTNRFDGERLVIDVSSDDPHNQGLPLEEIRNKIIANGVIINGLPILTGRNEHEERKQLIDYYQQQVIGGYGAFMIPALNKADYARAMLKKLILEIAGKDLDRLKG